MVQTVGILFELYGDAQSARSQAKSSGSVRLSVFYL